VRRYTVLVAVATAVMLGAAVGANGATVSLQPSLIGSYNVVLNFTTPATYAGTQTAFEQINTFNPKTGAFSGLGAVQAIGGRFALTGTVRGRTVRYVVVGPSDTGINVGRIARDGTITGTLTCQTGTGVTMTGTFVMTPVS
jgi:hypothetical protein